MLRVSRLDDTDPVKTRHCEIHIDFPFQILSCWATQANTILPAYTSPNSRPLPPVQHFDCGCPGASSLTRDWKTIQLSAANHDENTMRYIQRGSDIRSATLISTNIFGDLPRPPLAHLTDEHNDRVRPMHLPRAPSFAPPALDDAEPLTLVSPPPGYTSVVGGYDREIVLEDYFQRLSLSEENDGTWR